MKYPQLVSSRAVNEISDWLIKRLEDLDIEQPSVYSRLLLSLLHTPFKVNAIDLMEIPQLKDLKQPYHLLNKNNEELKRLAAVESLMEVSAEENKSNVISLVDELHLRLRKIESSCEENAIIGRTSNGVASTSPVTSTNSKFYKNLKKIKRNHGAENPTKNYYLAFPALSSKKTSTTITSGGAKMSPLGEVAETKKDSNLQLLCWSNLMSKDTTHPTSASVLDSEKFRNVVKMKTPRKKRRCGRAHSVKSFTKSDVQCNAKSYDMYDGATFSPKSKNGSKKHQRNQYGKRFTVADALQYASSALSPTATSKNQTKICGGDRGSNQLKSVHDALKVNFPPGPQQWDMDFKGHWEMDRDLISEFIQQQQPCKITKDHSTEAKATIQVERAANEEDDVMMMKYLPMKLMDDSNADDPSHAENAENQQLLKEVQSISSFKSKFDANVKALWNDVDDPLTKPLTQKIYGDGGNACLVNPFTSEKNMLSLFNFNGHQPHSMEVIAPCTNLQLYGTANTDFINMADFDNNNNNKGGRGNGMFKNHSSNAISPGAAEKFIKSGTNLLTSIWSDGEFVGEPQSLVYKDVVDHSDDAMYKKMKSIGAEMKNWQKSCAVDEECKVSLSNHSSESAFKRFQPLMTSSIIRASYHPTNAQQLDSSLVDQPAEPENLLASDKTHFSPLMLDGHTFIIDDSWDDIQWERSPSGSLMYEGQRYMKVNKSHQQNEDNFMCNNKIDLEAIEQEALEFTIKFLVKDENEKGCQTEINDFPPPPISRGLIEINEDYCKRKIYDEYCKGPGEANNNKWRYNTDDSNDYSFFSVNRVKDGGTGKSFQDILVSSTSSSSSICTITSSTYETSPADPFESWRSIKIDNGGMLDSNYKNACMHSLWEQCKTCTRNDNDPYVEKSIPANRLLKDELRMDGDEIMNVIQNLYITGDYCEDEEKDEEDCEDMNHFYMDMLDDSMDGSGVAEEENKFYEAANGEKGAEDLNKTFTPNMFEHQQREELLQLENFDEITMAKMQWQWDRTRETEKDQEKYLKLLKWIQSSLSKEEHPDPNNNFQLSYEDRRMKNRKRRHSTCHNYMENKTSRPQDLELTYHLNLSQSPTAVSFFEENANLLVDAAKMLKVNIEKIMLIADPSNVGSEIEHNKDENGANYYRNILQQQHALIKQMDLARPLTR